MEDVDTSMYYGKCLVGTVQGIPEWLATGGEKMADKQSEQEIKNRIIELKQELASLEIEQFKAKLPKTYSGDYFQVGINESVTNQCGYPIVVPSNQGGTVKTHDNVLTNGICITINEARECAQQLNWFADWAENNSV